MKKFFFFPSFLLKRPFFIKCDYGVNLYLPLKIILGWGILFTGRIHPVETEIIEKIYRSNPGNIILLGGYRDGWFNLALNNIVKKNKKKSFILEPVMEFYLNLKKNIQINNAKNINLISKGIANKKGIKKIYININSEGATSFLKQIKKKTLL